MPSPVHRQRTTALRSIVQQLATCNSVAGTALLLDHLFGPTRAQAGAVALSNRPGVLAAEHGLDEVKALAEPTRKAVLALAEHAMTNQRTVMAKDVRSDRQGIPLAGQIAVTGCTAFLATPIFDTKRPLGAIVLLFPSGRNLDQDTVAFVETASALLGLVLASRQPPPALPRPAPVDLSQQGHTSVALWGASVSHELEGPVAALALQHEEQRRLLTDLSIFSEGGDTPLGGAVAELAELTEEIGAVIARLRDTTDQLGQLGTQKRSPQSLDVSEMAREACSIMRPQLEERGILLETHLVPGAYVSGHREALLQMTIDFLALAGTVRERPGVLPHVVVRTATERLRVVLAIDDLGAPVDGGMLRELDRTPFAGSRPDEQRRLVLRLAGDVAVAHGGHVEVVPLEVGGTTYRIMLPALAAAASQHGDSDAAQLKPPAESPVRHVMVVDDDPVFTRAARRALRPHVVREAATASEAEIGLTETTYDPDLVICDLMLPGADGTALHRRILERRPDLAKRFLFVTGGTLGKDTADYIRDSGCAALRKPINLGTIRHHLSEYGRETVTNSIVKTLRREGTPF